MYDFVRSVTPSQLNQSITIVAGSPLLAAGGELFAVPELEGLTEATLQPVVLSAIAAWAEAGLAPETLSALHSVEFLVTDLPGEQLGLATSNTIYLDRDAAGYGWYVAAESGERRAKSGERRAESGEPGSSGTLLRLWTFASGLRVDLLTVVAHELGHVLGLGHDAGDDVMDAALPVGVRRLPGLEAESDAAFASGWDEYLLQ
jgi:hypothetical protein